MYLHRVEKNMRMLRKRFPEARIQFVKDGDLELWHIQYTDGYVKYTDTYRFNSGDMILVNCYDNGQRSK